MTTLHLSILDRLQSFSVLPKQGKIIEMEIAKNISEKLRPTSKEINDWQIVDLPDGRVNWNSKKAVEKPYNFEDAEFSILQKGAELLEASGSVTMDNLELVKKIQAAAAKSNTNAKSKK